MSVSEAAAHCPRCGAEYRAGFDTCADDGTPLVPGPAPEEPPAAPAHPDPPAPPLGGFSGQWVAVAEFRREEEARLLAGRLRAEGIEASVYPEWQGTYYGGSVQLPIRVMVLEDRLLEAHALLDRLGRS